MARAPSSTLLIAARAVQGAGAAVVTPLTLTLLAEAFPASRRGIALGVWSGISGAAVAIGPLIGGAVVQGISWHWIFWINVPIGLVLAPLAARVLTESRGPNASLDMRGLALASAGAFGVVFALVRAQSLGWSSTTVIACMTAGAILLALFVVAERAATEPMLPMAFFAKRAFAVTNVATLTMYFGMFGSIFFLSQFMQAALHNTPLQAGLKILVWTGATMVTAPLAGVFAARLGSRPFIIGGLSLQAGALAWLAATQPPPRSSPGWAPLCGWRSRCWPPARSRSSCSRSRPCRSASTRRRRAAASRRGRMRGTTSPAWLRHPPPSEQIARAAPPLAGAAPAGRVV